MRINTKLNRIDLTSAEQAVLAKADALTALIAKHSDGAAKDEASKAGFHLERLQKVMGIARPESATTRPTG